MGGEGSSWEFWPAKRSSAMATTIHEHSAAVFKTWSAKKRFSGNFCYCRDFLFVLVSFIFHKQGQHDQNAAGLQREGLWRSWSKAFVKTGISDCFDCFFLFNIGTTDCGCFSYFSLSKSLSLNEWEVLQLVCCICGRCPLVPEQRANSSFKFLSDYIFKWRSLCYTL